jgi:hypothetical protein
MKIVQKKFTKYSYDADHAFANPSNPKYDKVATAKANDLVIKFLKENFNTPLKKPMLREKVTCCNSVGCFVYLVCV